MRTFLRGKRTGLIVFGFICALVVGGLDHLVAGSAQRIADAAPDGRLVLDYHNATWSHDDSPGSAACGLALPRALNRKRFRAKLSRES